MSVDWAWGSPFEKDVRFGYVSQGTVSPRHHHPQVVLNADGASVLRTLREELRRCQGFTFSVAFVSPRAIALLKQELIEFQGSGRIITSDYLAFNSPRAFAELLNLRELGIDVRIHQASAFHPKGYIFETGDTVTVLVGSANLTEAALVKNHEWNLKVAAAVDGDLSAQVRDLVAREVAASEPLTQEWIDDYAASYTPPAPRASLTQALPPPGQVGHVRMLPNAMQREALEALKAARDAGEQRAIVISATGTGKTMLSAFDVEAFSPSRLLFLVHREQILDRTIDEYRRVIDAPPQAFGKMTGGVKQPHCRYLFATIQTLAQPHVLSSFSRQDFDYIIVDEAHRVGAPTYRRVVEYFTPKFLLGMTATPERTDGFNVFELFNFTVPYEIRLNHALEQEMLSPFHYYGVSEIQYDDGTTITDDAELSVLISPERVNHLLTSIAAYGQAGVQPRGLIFCSRKAEAKELSSALNRRDLRGKRLRTIALTGEDSPDERLAAVTRLENGDLDYILTVDIFNEGVDIPSVNQVIMLRQTQSAIVFVQQLGRGLRKAIDKEYLVVIDFIGNYQNNFMIPIALFGDESLNKESLRKSLIAAEESGVLPGLSSVRFDKIAQERVLASIASTSLDSMHRLKQAVESMRNRVGGVPRLWDFWRFESVDPVLLATKKEHYPALTQSLLKVETGLTQRQSLALRLLSHEVLPAKRIHEFVIAKELLSAGRITKERAKSLLSQRSIHAADREIDSAMDTLTLDGFAEVDRRRYDGGIAKRLSNDELTLAPELEEACAPGSPFGEAAEDLLQTGDALVSARYGGDSSFKSGQEYSRREVCRILSWPRSRTGALFGYFLDEGTASAAAFVKLHKSEDTPASIAYNDGLLSRTSMRWMSKSGRTLQSKWERLFADNAVALHMFVQREGLGKGESFFYLGEAVVNSAEEETMPGGNGKPLEVVEFLLSFREPIDLALYDYFHPVVTS